MSVVAASRRIAGRAGSPARRAGRIGVALLAAVFSGWGGLESPQRFVDGLQPALWVGAGAMALAVVAMALVPRSQVVAQEVR